MVDPAVPIMHRCVACEGGEEFVFVMATPVNCTPSIMDRTPIKSGLDGYQRLKNDHELFLEAYESKNEPGSFTWKPLVCCVGTCKLERLYPVL